MTNLPDPVLLAAVLGSLALLPFAALLVTCYTKLAIVFGLLRMALGTQQVPPNMVMNGLAILFSIFIMAPVGMDATDALKATRFSKGNSTFEDFTKAIEAVSPPFIKFLDKHAGERDRQMLMRAAEQLWPPERIKDITRESLLVLVPSFTLTELTKAFQVGFLLYLVFVVVDLLIGNLLLALGMSMVSPTTVSIPFKLMLFIALDGWATLVQGLLMSYK